MSDSSFIPERQLVFSPSLAQTIGLEEAVLLQHLSELFQHRQAEHRQGYRWLSIEREWLLETLPFWTSVDLHRISKSLADKGLILMDSPPLHDAESLVFAHPETIWYEDPVRKGIHSKLVREGMERAKQDGKRIGRPRVTDDPGFNERFDEVVDLIDSGTLSRRKAARELSIGYATLKRLLDTRSASGV